jgi:uncharacterized repeat protein (TIGR01451 family)
MRWLLRWATSGLLLTIALFASGARADTPVVLTKSFAGNVNFTGTQITMRNRKNNKPCVFLPSTTPLTATLSGIPAGATVVSAQLYWAGSNNQDQADYTVNFDGTDVSAPSARQYFSATVGGGLNYFAGAADVTAQVAAKGNGTYTFSGLSINTGDPWCKGQGVVLGGFSLLVIYSSAAEPFRVLNLYEGFQYFRYSGITLNLSNFQIPSTLSDTTTARIAHITWQGDPQFQQGGEQLLFNGGEMTDALNRPGDQFNSASNINNDPNSSGIDFDAYTIAPSSGLIKPGQTSATTRYQSSRDLVLLNAEVVAVPNVPTADLSLTMARGGALQVGADTSYTLSARNAGPSVDGGPITVADTVPSGMSVVSAGGSGWSCSVAGQSVTCTNAGSLFPGAALPDLTLVLWPSAPGTYVNSATVKGQTFDNQPANNTAGDTGTASASGAVYAFTTTACAAGATLGSSGCMPFSGPVTAGTPATLYVTTVAGGVAQPVSASADTPVALRFSLSCVDPAKNQGVRSTLAGVGAQALLLPLCADAGALPASGSASWSQAVTLSFARGQPSVALAPGFAYEDVGMVSLNLIDSSNQTASAGFVVRPAQLAFAAVKRTRDGANNPPDPASGSRPGFVKAGEAFTLVVGARTSSGNWAPNFGNEQGGTGWSQIRLQQVQERDLPLVQGAFEGAAGGFVTGTGFWWDEAGVVNLAPVLSDYLGTKAVDGAAVNIGRFYPDHLGTTAYPAFACLPGMACPAPAITGGAYSAQPFKVEVRAFGATDKPLSNYDGATILLSAYDSPGGSKINPNGGALGTATDTAVKSTVGDLVATANPYYQLPAPFAASAPRALNWTAPTAIYLRASAAETVIDATGQPQPTVISSARPSGSMEGGIMIVDGRLQLANAFGSELLALPVQATGQYWNGAAWLANTNDDTSQVLYASNLLFTDCQGKLAVGTGSNNCNPALVKPLSGAALTLHEGAGSFSLAAPGTGNTGSAWLRVNDSPSWLPSVKARATFGVYRSPVIYLREVH